MATTIVTKNSSTAAAVPTAAQLVQGELAVNVADKRLYTEDSVGGIVELGTNPSAEIVANGGIALPDNGKATFGAGDDLQIFHDGSNSIIKDGGTGNLNILAGQLRIKNPTDAESLIEADVNGAVRLYHDNAEKLATTATGIDVTGNVSLPDNGKATFGASDDLQIYHSGAASIIADVGTGNLVLQAGDFRLKNADSTETMILANAGSTVQLYHDNAVKLATTATGINVTGTATATVFEGSINSFNTESSSAITAKNNFYIDIDSDNTATNRSFRVTHDGATKTLLDVQESGDISFYEDTGTTAKLFWDASAESLGIGTDPSSYGNTIVADQGGNYTGFNDQAGLLIRASSGTTGDGQHHGAISFSKGTGQAAISGVQEGSDADVLGLAFWTHSSGTGSAAAEERMRIDSSGNVGIGTSSPAQTLHVESSASGASKIVSALVNPNSGVVGTGAQLWLSGSNATTRGTYIEGQVRGTGNKHDLIFATSADASSPAERMRIDSAGNVGIGTSTNLTGSRVHIAQSAAGANKGITLSADGTSTNGYADFSISPTDTLTIQMADDTAYKNIALNPNGGNVGIGTSSPDSKLHISSNSTADFITLEHTSGPESYIQNSSVGSLILSADGTNTGASSRIEFKVDNTERMRIDSAGNLLVGKTTTSSALTTTGIDLRPEGRSFMTRSAGPALYLSRTTSDGNIAEFYKDGTTVGSIGNNGTAMYIGSPSGSEAHLLFTNNRVQPCTGTGASRDNIIDLGISSARFDDIYATNGTIQTSDRNEKQDIAELSGAEQRVAVACKGLLRKFRWKDSVAEKGDDARIHFGIIAQDLQAAFAAEGLDAGDYAMFISTTWTDEETNEEKTRMGVRYSELLAFIIAAL